MFVRDSIAIFFFVGVLLASCLTEFYCGAASEHCPINWSSVYGTSHEYFAGHCSAASPDTGLGDPLLTISSLFLLVPLTYFSIHGPIFTPPTSAFLGIASFLFHAANTNTTAIMDYVGIIIFGPSIFADFLFTHSLKKVAAFVYVVMLVLALCLRIIVGKVDNLIYITQPIFTVLILAGATKKNEFKLVAPAAFLLIAGSVTLIVANSVDEFWKCTKTQLIEPHFWGHLLIGAGATIYARIIFYHTDYTKI